MQQWAATAGSVRKCPEMSEKGKNQSPAEQRKQLTTVSIEAMTYRGIAGLS